METIYKVLKIDSTKVTVENKEGEVFTSSRITIPKNAKVGDLIRHTEHHFYDLIDENRDIISKW